MGFVLQDRILQPFLQIFSPLSGGRIDTFWSRRRTKQPHPGTIRPLSESGKRHEPEGGTGGAGGRTETGGTGASNGRDRRAPEPKKKRRRRGRSREGNVAGGKAMRGEDAEAGKGDAEGSEQGRQCGRRKGHAGRGRGGRERRRGGVGAGKAMWPGKGVERPGPEKGRCRGWRKSYAGGKGQRNAVSIQQAERNLRQGSSAPQGDAGSAI